MIHFKLKKKDISDFQKLATLFRLAIGIFRII